MADLATLVVNLRGDISDLKANMNRAQGVLGGIQKTALKLGGVLAGAFAVGQISNYIQKTVELAGVQAAAEAKVRQAILSTGKAAGLSADELFRVASELQKITTFGDEQILNDVTAQLLTFTNIAGDNFFEAQKAALNLATVLGTDLRGASIQLGKALNDPTQGLTALRRVGVAFTEEQQNTIKGFVETNQLAKAQTVILSELERQYGGQAEAAAKAGAGPIKQFQNALGDLNEKIGGVILPALTSLAKSLTNEVIPAIERTIDKVKALGPAFEGLRSEWQAYKTEYPGFFKAFGATINGVIATLSTLVETVILAGRTVLNTFNFIGNAIDAALNPNVTLKGEWDKYLKDSAGAQAKWSNNLTNAWGRVGAAAKGYGKEVRDEVTTVPVPPWAVELPDVFKKAKTEVEGLGKAVRDGFTQDGQIDKESEAWKRFAAATEAAGANLQLINAQKDIQASFKIELPGEDDFKAIIDGFNKTDEVSRRVAEALQQIAIPQEWINEDNIALNESLALRDDLIERNQAVADSAASVYSIIGGATERLAKSFLDGKNGLKEFGKALADFVKEAIAKLLALAAVAAIVSAILPGAGGFGKVFGLLRGGGGGGFDILKLLQGIPKFASGGIVTRPTLGLVGEAGPEAVLPLSRLGNYAQAGAQTLTARVSGPDLLFILEDAQRRRGNTL